MDLLADFTLARRSFDLRATLSVSDETVVLVGPSGSGKTSLLRAVAGLERPAAGQIILGEEIWLDARRGVHVPPERRRVGFLPQDYGLFPHLTVAGNVRFAGRRDRPDLLARLGIAQLADVRPAQLSGGERQRAALARALAREPRVLLLDEPFAALDAITRKQVRDELAELLASLRLPTLLVTHDFDDAGALGARVGVIDRGKIVQLAPAPELLRDPASALVAALTGANVLEGMARPTGAGSIVRLNVGGELVASTPARGPVQVVIHPWAFEVTEPQSAPLTENVLSLRSERGTLVIRTAHLTVHAPLRANGRPPLAEGSVVGLRVAPADVRVLKAET